MYVLDYEKELIEGSWTQVLLFLATKVNYAKIASFATTNPIKKTTKFSELAFTFMFHRSFDIETSPDTKPMGRPMWVGRGSNANAREEPTQLPTTLEKSLSQFSFK